MVGKPNLPRDADERADVKGSATKTPGLTPVDQEREASMADEGGASGAAVETEDQPAGQQDSDGVRPETGGPGRRGRP